MKGYYYANGKNIGKYFNPAWFSKNKRYIFEGKIKAENINEGCI